MKRRSKGGVNKNMGITYTIEDGTEYVTVDLNNIDETSDLFTIVCYNKTIPDILKLREIMAKIDDTIKNKKLENINETEIQSLKGYEDIPSVKEVIDMFQGILNMQKEYEKKITDNNAQNISQDTTTTEEQKITDNNAQNISQDTTTTEEQKIIDNNAEDVVQDITKESQITDNNNAENIVQDTTEEPQITDNSAENIVQDITKESQITDNNNAENIVQDTTEEQKTTENNNIVNDKQTINNVEDIQPEADNIEQTTGNEKTNEITKKVDDLMKEVATITDSTEIEIKEEENINRDIEKEQNLDSKLVEIFNVDLEQIYIKHPVLYDIIIKKRYKPVYRLPLLRAIAIIQNKKGRNSLIDELEKILGDITRTDELTKIISELDLIKNSDISEFKYGGKMRFNRKRKSSKRKSSKRKSSKKKENK